MLDQELHVDGQQVPGTWWMVEAGTEGWIALRTDGTWWWGRDTRASQLAGLGDSVPVISPNGRYIAMTTGEGRSGVLTGFETTGGGEGVGETSLDLGDRQKGTAVTVRAVTDDGRVVAQGGETAVLWSHLVPGGGTVDLTATAPGQVFLDSSPAGLIVTDGADGTSAEGVGGQPYLADLAEDGQITRTATLPPHDDLIVSPAGTWRVWTPSGTLGGEVASLSTLEAASARSGDRVTVSAPDGWAFRVHQWTWESDDFFVAVVTDEQSDRLTRCSPATGRCLLVPAP